MTRPKLAAALLFAVVAFLLSPRPDAARADEPLKLGQEQIPAGEAEVIDKLVALQVAIMKGTDPTKRGQHPKQHGCVEAEFAVRDDVPKDYQIGVFKTATKFEAKIRFSNGLNADDTKPDVRGFAIKVLGVKGPRNRGADESGDQDFILADSPSFFAPDVKTTLALLGVLAARPKDPDSMKKFAEQDPATARRFGAALKPPPASPLAIPYWSQVPSKLGSRAVKYTVQPAAGNTPAAGRPAGPDSLRAAMVEHLTTGKQTAEFVFCIIPQTDPLKEPVEDPTVAWESTPVPVATITIKSQTFDTPAQLSACEAAVFDPWNGLADHRPLGGISRARKAVYPASVDLRQKSRRP